MEATCEEAGMHAVCPGGSKCAYNGQGCIVSPISPDGCGYRATVSQHLCGLEPRRCPPIDNMFLYMSGYTNGDMGVVGNAYWAFGKNYVSRDNGQVYYAYCVTCGDTSGIHC